MKIAFVMHNLIRGDGQGRVQYEIVRYFLDQGHEAVLFADVVAPELVERGARWIKVPKTPSRPNLFGIHRFASAADRALARVGEKFDAIFAAGFTMWGAHDLSTCHFVHGSWIASPAHVSRSQRGPTGWYQWLYSRCNARWERRSYSAARRVVAISQRIRDELVGIGVPAGKISLIYNGVDLEEFKPATVSRVAFNLPADVPMALFVGDIRTRRKNLDTVLKALLLTPAVHLAVVGDIMRSPFPSMARELGIANRVHFLGFRRDVADITRACDFLAFPTRYEPFGSVVLEAMATGIPVIVSAAAGAAEVLGDPDSSRPNPYPGQNPGDITFTEAGAILGDAEDAEGLAAIMRCFADDPERRRQRGRAARRIAEGYSWQRMAESYLELARESVDAPAHCQS
jgi:glycosyltransferase involved in cell wall biosynthesis